MERVSTLAFVGIDTASEEAVALGMNFFSEFLQPDSGSMYLNECED
jgi:hypothetical protein